MINSYTVKGVNSKVQVIKSKSILIAVAVFAAAFLGACSSAPTTDPGSSEADPNAIAARINGKVIKMEEVEKAIKAQTKGEDVNLSPLELASARLSVLQSLIQAEVMFQKAEKEQTVPTDDEVTAEMNRRKTSSGLSAEEFDRQMKQAGETEASWRQNVKREIALQKLQDKIAGRVESPRDSEIEAFYNSNREQFKKKRGAELAAIVIDPANSGQGDTTTNETEASIRARDVGQRALSGADFATLAGEYSEDLGTRSNGGSWRYFTEDELKQTFGTNVSDFVMTKMRNGDVVPTALTLEGKLLIVKLQSKQEVDEDLTLDSPKVRPQVTELLINARKNLLWQSYIALAMNEAKVENILAKKVVDNPNELSGARRAGPAAPANTPASNAAVNTPANSAQSNSNAVNSTAENSGNSTSPANTNK